MFSKETKGFSFTIVRCRKCGFVFMNPMITKKGLKKVYTYDYYKFYNLHAREDIGALYAADASAFREIQNQSGIHSGNLLDIGCAQGFFLHSVKKNFSRWNVFGCDISRECTEFGKNKLKLKLRTGTVEDCRYPEKFFDIVKLRETIEHLENPIGSLNEINRILKKGGYVAIETGNVDSMISKIYGRRHPYFDITHVSYFSIATLKYALEKTGFDIVKTGGIYYAEKDILKKGFDASAWLRLMRMQVLDAMRFGNFSVMGGIRILARKR
jgi:2-polyprenyl-3-methyl-5-hydroxy-6-metoxy-1,4-benzoquinol methylase